MRSQKRLESSSRAGERGAALVSVLLISMLLLSAGGVLLVTTTMSSLAPIDSAAEMQAYYAAESGLQRALNVMRSNDIPAGTMPAGKTKLTFRDIVQNPTLANWLPFDGPTINGAPTTLVSTNAFSVTVLDPDDQNPVVALRKINTNPNYQPSRLSIQVTGYGPRRARKILNTLIMRGSLNGLQLPATITLVGSDSGAGDLRFDTGNSNVVRYTGNNGAGGAGVSAFAVTIPDVPPTLAGIQRPTQVEGPPLSVLGVSSPFPNIPPTPAPEWLQSADNARAFLADMQEDAVSDNRYFTTKPPASDMGTSGDPKFTFVDGDVDLGPGNNGTGLLVVTGDLTMHGNTSFDGVILVLGGGHVRRNGGGNGVISGGIVVASFGPTGGFQAPTFTTNGGGNSLIEYNSDSVGQATTTVPGFQVLGVVEK